MDRKRYGAIMLALSMVYAGLLGLLAVLGSDAVAAVAVVGGTIVGLGWALFGAVTKEARE